MAETPVPRNPGRADSLVLIGLFIILGGAVAQAVNTVGVGEVREAMDMEGASALQTFIQSLVLPLTIAFGTTLAGSRLILRHAIRHGWVEGLRFSAAPGSRALHRARLAVGYTATALIFGGIVLLTQQKEPVGMATLAANTPGFVTAILMVGKAYLERRREQDATKMAERRLTLREALVNAIPAPVGLAGVVVAAVYGQPVGGVLMALVALAGGWFLLGILPLIQRSLQEREAAVVGAVEGRSPRLPAAMVTVKITFRFAAGGFAISASGLLASVVAYGWPKVFILSLLIGAAILGASYPASQALIQSANGLGAPALNGPIMYLAVPVGYLLDPLRGLPGFNAERGWGTSLIVVAALVAMLIAWQRLRRSRAQG